MTSTPSNSSPTSAPQLLGPGGLVHKFLGLPDNPITPAQLLRTPPNANATHVMEALHAALGKIAEHPEGQSAPAGQVRAFLYAQAMRLISDEPEPEAPSPAYAAEESLTREVRHIIAVSGGWNPDTQLRAAQLAAVRGVPFDRLMTLLSTPPRASSPTARPSNRTPSQPATPRTTPPQPRPAATSAPVPRPVAQSAPTNPDAVLPFPPPDEIDPTVRVVRTVLIGGTAAALLLVAVGAVAWVLWNLPAPATPPAPAPNSTQTAGPIGPPPPTTPPTTNPPAPTPTTTAHTTTPPAASDPLVPNNRVGDWTDLVRAVDAAASMLDADRATSERRFEAAAVEMSRRWTQASADQRLAAVDVLITFLYRGASDDASARQLVGILAAGTDSIAGVDSIDPAQVLPAAWSGGVLARLTRENNLSSSARTEVRRAFDRAFPGSSAPATNTFDAGAASALAQLTTRLIPTASTQPQPRNITDAPKLARERWAAWIDAQRALLGETPDANRALLLALDALLTQSASPALRKDAFESVDALARAIRWRPGDESREWLLRWFDSQTVTNASLFALTSALATGANAPNVDPSMVLPATADSQLRADLRTRYASAWGLSGGTSRDSLIADWAKAARSEIDATSNSVEPIDRLRRAAILARLNTTAERLYRGDTSGVGDSLSSLTLELDLLNQSTRSNALLDDSSLGSDAWLIRYRSAGSSTPQRKELLTLYTSKPNIIDAGVIMEEALRGSPSQIRIAARAIVLRSANTPEMAWALLNLAPTMPLTADSAEVVSLVTGTTLPSLRSPGFRVAARRALVNHMLDLMAGSGELRNVESLSRALAITYAQRLDPLSSKPDPNKLDSKKTTPPKDLAAPDAEKSDEPPDPTAAVPATSAKLLRSGDLFSRARDWQARLLRDAEASVPSGKEPTSLPAIIRRRAAREALALGKVQEFAAQQVAGTEALAYTLVTQKPELAPDARNILDSLQTDRGKAPHIFFQIESAERASLQLWLLRLVQPASTGLAPSPVDLTPTNALANNPAALFLSLAAATNTDAETAEPLSAAQRFTSRLQSLDPAQPHLYLELGEEVADAATNPADRRLAIELFVLAFELDRAKPGSRHATAASACLALADLSPAGRDRTWLQAIALTLDPGAVRPRWLTRTSPNSADSTNFQLSTWVGLVRAGEGRKAKMLLERREVNRALDASDRLMRQLGIDGGADALRMFADRWPCPECANAGAIRRNRPPSPNSPNAPLADYHACPNCHGYSAPRLSDNQILAQLRFEAYLLSGTQDSWTSQIAVDMGAPLQDPDPDALARTFAINPALSVWREGHWTAPAPATPPPAPSKP